MNVLFYTATLSLQVNGSAYPGKEAALTGTFDYGAAPVPATRSAAIYLDNNLEQQFNAGPVFNQNVTLAAKITPGQHSLTVSAAADDRYAPVLANFVLNVTRAATSANLQLPGVGWIPGSFTLSGQLSSSTGPLDNATVIINAGKASKQIITAPDGSFATKIGLGFSLSLLGTQAVTLQVQPQEPWNAPLTVNKNIFLINYINLILILLVLIALAVYLPRRFRKWFSMPKDRPSRLPGLVPPLMPQPQAQVGTAPRLPVAMEKTEEGDNTVSFWYRVALKVVQAVTKLVIAPQQTLREYGKAVSAVLGPAGKYFTELTHLEEKRLYGKASADAAAVRKSRDLAQAIQKEAERKP